MRLIKKLFLNILDYFNYILINKNSYHSFKTAHNKNFKHFEHLYKKLITIENPIIFDVGGNLGQSIKLFKKYYPTSKIYSFEPIYDCFNKMKSEFSNNDDINIYNFAVGNKVEKKSFNVYEDSAQSSFFEKNKNSYWFKKHNQTHIRDRNQFKLDEKKIDVEVITLDNFCKKYEIGNIDFLKIDTQGYEEFVLEGSQNLLKENKIKIIKLEMIFSDLYSKKHSFFDIEKHLQNNYKLISINNFGNTIDDANFNCDVIYVSKNLNF
tara:strand:- start:497 stop:1291 length:795 start_codon:yes stop_codon:yes gene_type:complete